MDFEWDPAKATTNRRKHGVSFEEAMTVFDDSRAIERFDSAHSNVEERYVTLGTSKRLRLLLVVHTLRNSDAIRLISARRATSGEASEYAQS